MKQAISELKAAIRDAWTRETCFPAVRDSWTSSLPETGQCAVTALVVQEKLGGKIAFNQHYNHYWNVLSNGSNVDLTIGQFAEVEQLEMSGFRSRNYILNSPAALKYQTLKRYKRLKKTVEDILQSEVH